MLQLAKQGESELRPMLRLAVPLVLAELGWMAMGVVDTMFVGRIGPEAIGAVGLGAMVYYGISIVSGGVLLGLDTMVARDWGAKNLDGCRRSLINGIWLALFLTLPVMLAVRACEPLLQLFGIDPKVLETTRPYIRALNWSTLPLLLYFALRRYLQAVHAERAVMMTLLTANVVNALGCWALVFGHLGFPRMGAEGAGWSTCISRIFMAGALMVVLLRKDPGVVGASHRPALSRIRELLRLGIPSAGQMGVEIGVFALVTVLVGKLGALTLAGHQIALTTVSTTFMMPLGISSAAAVRVGHALGRGDGPGAARAGWAAMKLGAGVMSVAALVLLTAPQWIARLFTPDASVIAAAVGLLRVAAFFQLFDGLQIVATGALRGLGDTRTPMMWHFLGYWVLGLPIGATLCFGLGWGATGLWVGLSLALIAIGTVLAMVWRKKSRECR